MNLHWQVIITQSPTFALLFILGVVYSFNLPVQSLSCVWLFVTPWIVACQASLSPTLSRSLSKFMSIHSVMPSSQLILCHPLFLLPSVFPSISSVQFSHSVMFDSLWPYWLQHAGLPCPSPIPGACSNSYLSSRRCHPTISSSVIPFSSWLQSSPEFGSLLRSQFFTCLFGFPLIR